MNKVELSKVVSEKTGITKKQAAEVVDAVFETIVESLKRNEEVKIGSFGQFKLKVRAAREARNPATGETIFVPSSTGVTFKPSKVLKDQL
ncbi:TPA: HU family DNA-binding protein [bacterium]|nr:HU family DNA-binding protein [bacterium]